MITPITAPIATPMEFDVVGKMTVRCFGNTY